ncbi:glycosyltransferase family 2 protein [Streptomyces sp. SDT5-1]|uniref:glycosyltransferase family 2 protein n=1 Tax=Streptomyces sp. SDT5-1 TaxID=3406418 RepID=UPI003FD33905
MTPVKVTVIIPTHNTGEDVMVGLDALRKQSMPRSDFEVLYVDDGSTDDTVAFLERELAGEDNMHVVPMTNSGWPGRPRNTGVDRARGEYVHFVDDDDWLAPEALERLYARAKETDADIVVGRMAGHGRGAPRAPFAKPLERGSVRENPVLLGAMTVHKLFRRRFLLDHGLRFDEGRVRLEDHLFTLRAYLLAKQVSTVADYTTYHWVRHGNGKHNISYTPIEPAPYIESVRRIIGLLHAPDTRVEDDELRHRFTANWYGSKALRRLTGKGFLGQDEERRAAWRQQVIDLAADLPTAVDRHLPERLAVLSRLCRAGDHEAIHAYTLYEAGVRHRPKVEESTWQGGVLRLRASTSLVRTDPETGESTPLLFRRSVHETAGGKKRVRWTWQPPAPLDGRPDLADALDFTQPLKKAKAQALVHHKSGGTQIVVTTGTSKLQPVPHAADPDLWEMHWTTDCTIDPAGVDAHSGPLEDGTWQVCLRLNVGGWLTSPRLSGLKLSVGAPKPAAASKPKAQPKSTARTVPATRHPLHGVAKVAVPVLRLLLPAAAYVAVRDRYRRLVSPERTQQQSPQAPNPQAPNPVAVALDELQRAKRARALSVSSTRRT